MIKLRELWAAVAVDPGHQQERVLRIEWHQNGKTILMTVVGPTEGWVIRALDECPEGSIERDRIVIKRFVLASKEAGK